LIDICGELSSAFAIHKLFVLEFAFNPVEPHNLSFYVLYRPTVLLCLMPATSVLALTLPYTPTLSCLPIFY